MAAPAILPPDERQALAAAIKPEVLALLSGLNAKVTALAASRARQVRKKERVNCALRRELRKDEGTVSGHGRAMVHMQLLAACIPLFWGGVHRFTPETLS